MTVLEFVTRASIWLSVGCWAWVVAALIRGRATAVSRWVWGAGADLYLVHAVAAFGAFYDWSHLVAVEETAVQTLAATGFNSGMGIWFNYAFGLVWIVDAGYWWLAGTESYRKRSCWIQWFVHGFMGFMVFNGTVVFGEGPVVVLGALLSLWLGAAAVQRLFIRARDGG